LRRRQYQSQAFLVEAHLPQSFIPSNATTQLPFFEEENGSEAANWATCESFPGVGIYRNSPLFRSHGLATAIALFYQINVISVL
jgi:hypothetical protein